MKTYCKNIDPTDPAQIKPFVELCLAGKYGRRDFQAFLAEYCDLTLEQIAAAARGGDLAALEPAVWAIASDVAGRIKRHTLGLAPIRYFYRRDKSNNKLRLIGCESPLHQVMDYVAVYCLMPLFEAKIGRYQCASIPGRGQIYGKRAIERFVRRDNKGTKSKYFAKLDVRHCYESLTKRAVMRRLERDIHKNKPLLWFVGALLDMFKHGFSIGSFLSQYLCNYMLSYAYHYATEQLFKLRRHRDGTSSRVRLTTFVLFYMDDMLLTGSSRKDLKTAVKRLCEYLRGMGLEIKSVWHIKELAREPIDMMGYVIRRDRTTIRARIFLRARRQFMRAWRWVSAGGYITIETARRLVSYRGYFRHSNSTRAEATLHIVEVSRVARAVISRATKKECAA
jgi:RNA-directed DNA polymerase